MPTCNPFLKGYKAIIEDDPNFVSQGNERLDVFKGEGAFLDFEVLNNNLTHGYRAMFQEEEKILRD